jgi:hypothetical protein
MLAGRVAAKVPQTHPTTGHSAAKVRQIRGTDCRPFAVAETIRRQSVALAPCDISAYLWAATANGSRLSGRIVRTLEAADTMRLQAVCVPDALDRQQGDPDGLRQGAAGLARDLTGRLGAGEGEHLGDCIGGMGRLAGRTGLVVQEALDALFAIELLPAPHRGPTDACLLCNVQDGEALGRE